MLNLYFKKTETKKPNPINRIKKKLSLYRHHGNKSNGTLCLYTSSSSVNTSKKLTPIFYYYFSSLMFYYCFILHCKRNWIFSTGTFICLLSMVSDCFPNTFQCFLTSKTEQVKYIIHGEISDAKC